MIDFLLKIGTTDVTGHIVQNTYKVNNLPVYKTYEDADGVVHRRFIRNKLKGKFKMVFSDVEDYASFKTLYDANYSASNYTVTVTAYDNKTGDYCTVNAFFDYEPEVKQSVGLTEYIDVFDVTLEER